MTVRETIDFSARCQGVGSRAGDPSYLLNPRLFHKVVINTLPLDIHIYYILCIADVVAEITRREKEEGIIPDADIDTYMKVILV